MIYYIIVTVKNYILFSVDSFFQIRHTCGEASTLQFMLPSDLYVIISGMRINTIPSIITSKEQTNINDIFIILHADMYIGWLHEKDMFLSK